VAKNEKRNVLTNEHYGWWRCGFLTRSTAHLIATWQQPKKFRVWTDELTLSFESLLAHPIHHQMLSSELSSFGPLLSFVPVAAFKKK
jgi:hypothetical protein